MSVYGHNGAFEGLGKPSIRLEFETNDELVDFQRRMQGNDGGDNPDDGGSFTPGDKALDVLSRLATNRPYLKVHTNEPDDIDDEEPAEWDGNKQEFETIEGYGDKYIVTDLRQRAKKEPGEVKNLTKFQFSKFKNAPELFEPVVSVSPSLFGVYPVFKGINNDIVYFEKEFSDNYNADFILKDYVINKSERLVTLNFARYKAYGTDGVSIVSVWSFSISCPVCNIITAYSSKIDAYFGLIEFTEGLIAVLKNAQSKLRSNSKDYKTLQHQIERWQDAANQYADSLGKAGDLYLVRDMRSNRARKEPGELAANKNLKFEKQKNDTIKNFNKELYAAPTLANGNKEINGKTYYPVKFGYKYGKNDRYISEMYLFIPKIYNASENKMRGSWRSFDVVIDADKLYNIERNPYSGGFQAYEDEATLRENTNNALRQAFADVQRNVDYQKEQIEKEKNSPWKSNGMIAKREKYLKEAYKELKYFIMFYANYGKYPAWIISDNNGGDYPAKMAEDIPEGYIDRSIFAANLAAPGDVYLVTDTRKKPRKELDNVTALKKYDIRKFSGEELQKMQTDDPLLYEQIKSDINTPNIGRTAPAALYNNNAIMDCKGMRPTYRQLPDYSQFFAPANNATTLAGSGLTDTMQLIADTCRRNYKDCAKIAAHLKGDCKLQSAFNLWHWMRNNIKYEYDSEGKEEVRTPLRTWQDRKRGVDCDCLSVFAWCTLYNMGYNPMFELAAFNGKENYSHIYLNLDGIIIDRVWYIFNTRPPQVTKTALFGVDMTKELIGKLF